MKEQLISFETAKEAKKKKFYYTNVMESYGAFDNNMVQYYDNTGTIISEQDFNPDCCVPDKENDYDGEIPCVTQSFLQKWLREKYNLHLILRRGYSIKLMSYFYVYNIQYKLNTESTKRFKTYEQALEEGLQEALSLI